MEETSERLRVRRLAERGVYDRKQIDAILDEALICHVGIVAQEGYPVVIPTIHARLGNTLYLHGSPASRLLRSMKSQDEICVTVTLLDGLVVARSAFHNSMNYRSVVVRGTATKIEERAAKLRALKIITDHVVENWDLGRPVSEVDERKTLVLELPLAEASAKIRAGDPIDEEADMTGEWWAGVIPIETRFGAPQAAADYTGSKPVPAAFEALSFL